MGDGDELLKEIKSRMNDKDNPLGTDAAVQFLLSLQIGRAEKDKLKEAKQDKKDDAQDTVNDKVKILWRERKVILGAYAAILLGILGVIFDAINISIDF